MKNDSQAQLELIKDTWDKLSLQEDFTSWGYPEISKTTISDALGGLIAIAGQLAETAEYAPSPISKAALQFELSNLQQNIASNVPNNPQATIGTVLTQIEQARVRLMAWLEESNEDSAAHAIRLSERLGEMTSRLNDSQSIYDILTSTKNDVQELATRAKADVADIIKSRDEISANQITVAANAAIVSTATQQTKADGDQTKALIAELTGLKVELESNKKAQKILFDQFEGYKNKVSSLLGDANRTGMAASFVERKKELNRPVAFWGVIFGLSIVALAAIGYLYVAPAVNADDWKQVLYRLPLTAPVIWLGWFAAKQYGYSVRLREDYAYKVASAMSFEGYKREAAEAGKELQQKLLDTSIRNFGDNPLRIYEGHQNHVSPLNELLEKSLKDEKVMDLLKALFSKARS